MPVIYGAPWFSRLLIVFPVADVCFRPKIGYRSFIDMVLSRLANNNSGIDNILVLSTMTGRANNEESNSISMTVARWILLSAVLLVQSCTSLENESSAISFALVHPPYSESYRCSEHREGELPHLGDALGADCTIERLVDFGGRVWLRSYESDGRTNEQWYGYGADVLAPCDCRVLQIRVSAEENKPGIPGTPPASHITFLRSDGVHILFAHIRNVRVSVGESVVAGEIVASVGNNGYSRHPHLHIGAWLGEYALQIRFDQTRMKPVVIEPKP